MNVLVTGAEGQLGKALSALVTTGKNRCQDTFLFAGRQVLDLTDGEAVSEFFAGHPVDVVINCAAYTNVDRAETECAAAYAVNRDAAARLAVACRNAGATLIHISSDYVFSGEASVPYTEDAKTVPATVYGQSKLAGEKAVTDSGCDYIIVRTSWLYGSDGKNFVKTILRLAGEKDLIRVVSDQYGSPTNADGLAAFLYGVVTGRKHKLTGIYHYSDSGECTWFDFASEIVRLAEKYGRISKTCDILPCTTAEFPTVARRPAYSVLDKSRTAATFGVRIPEWKDSLENYFKKERQSHDR